MAATASVIRPPPAHVGPNGGNPHATANGGGPTAQLQVPGLHGTGRDPGPSPHPQHHVSARPVFYVHAPPPPPFLPYQWPMPFSYNPYAGFPGMGYGMVMPPFPPPYMEAPAYIMPHPHMQPVDYRRLLHPPCAPHYQNPNQARRCRAPHTGPVRETVNSEVQTEPTQRGAGSYSEESPLICSDSGRGTASNSPSPSGSLEGGSAEVENCGSDANAAVKRCFNDPGPTGTKAVQSHLKETLETQKNCKECVGQENVHPCRNPRCNVWSRSSPDSMVPVCSSSQQEEEVIVKERRVSVPDILMSWGGGTPQATMPQATMPQATMPQATMPPATASDELPQDDRRVESHQSVYQSRTETRKGPAAEGNFSPEDCANLFKIVKLKEALEARTTDEYRSETEPASPCRDESLRLFYTSHKLLDNGEETNPHEDTTDVVPCQISLNGFQTKRRMNESVWSVESLAPFIPMKEWLLQNSVFEPQVIVETTTAEAENGSSARRRILRCSSSESVLLSDSLLVFSTPAAKQSPPKKPETEGESDAAETRKRDQSMPPSENDPSTSQTRPPQSEIILSTVSEEDVDKNRSSEPEATRSPNQEALIVNEQQEDESLSSTEHEETLLSEKLSLAGLPSLRTRAPTEAKETTEVKEAKEAPHRNEDVSRPSEPRKEQLSIPPVDQETADVSPSKGRLVSCGIQCNELQEVPCCCCGERERNTGPSGWRHFNNSDVRQTSNGHDGFSMKLNNHKKYHRRNKGQADKQSGQQEACYGYNGKPRGGRGRNSRY